MKEKILAFLKKEVVFEIAFILALASSIFLATQKIQIDVLHAIDWRVLAILLSLMLVVAGFQKIGFFTWCANIFCRRLSNLRSLSLVLILLCFFSSMLITNDVALITFVPFALMIINSTGNLDRAAYIIVLQTIAANLGSMLTPLGNPQNLFLFSKMNLPLGNFILILLPYTFLSLILLFASIFFIPKRNLPRNIISSSNRNRDIKGAILFPILFVLCILCVLNIVPYWIVLPVVFAATAIYSAPLLLKADYMLLLTFCGFFIFTHNIAQIPEIKTALQNAVAGHEFWISLVASQVISNVPATLLLYPFSQNTKDLLLGVDIGGLGTLIASLASLISFKIYTNSSKSDKSSLAKYLGLFTLMNVLFLIAEIALFLLLKIKK